MKPTLFYRIHRHIERNALQKVYRQSEQFVDLLPPKLKALVAEKTHGQLQQSIYLFKNSHEDLLTYIISNL